MELKRLTSLRAFGALIVFFFHVRFWTHEPYRLNAGFVGVAFFFVLSGFVLTWAWRPGSTARDFFARRFARIYPSHFVTAIVAIILPVIAVPLVWQAIPVNLLLIQAWFPQTEIAFGLNGVSWSLSCEAFFYAVAPFVIIWTRRRRLRWTIAMLLTWYVLTATASAAIGINFHAADIPAYTNPLLRSGEFAVGILLAAIVQRGWRLGIPLWIPLAMIIAALGILSVHQVSQSLADVIITPLCALAVLAAASADTRGRHSMLHHRVFTYAGEVSFAFYLVHELVTLNVEPFVGGSMKSRLAWIALALVVAAGAAVLLHELIEKPCQRAFRRVLVRPKKMQRRDMAPRDGRARGETIETADPPTASPGASTPPA